MAKCFKAINGLELELFIEKLLYGGDGLAHQETMACFVRFVIPGEKVIARVNKVKKQYLLTTPIEILTPSENRTEPECQYFKLCGGCHWQHIKYIHQLYWKTEILRECLSRIASINDIPVEPPIPSPSIFNYRSRSSFKIGNLKEPVVGYFQNKSHEIVPVKQCLLLAAPLNNALKKCIEFFRHDQYHFNNISELDMIHINHSGQVLISLNKNKKGKATKLLYNNITNVLNPFENNLNEKIMGIDFKRNIDCFYQVNYEQNLRMVRLVLGYFESIKNCKILDLYCGCGNFSLFLARYGAQVTGIDSNASSIREAVYNAEQNNITGCSFLRGDLNNFSISTLNDKYDGVLLNPPRSGCSRQTLKKIVAKKPLIIVYVSCNPSTLARDLPELISSGYTIEEIQPVDMFPQTFHIETVVKLSFGSA